MRWGIMGTGGIAATMHETLTGMGASVVAVGSARQDAADRFAGERGIPRAVAPHRAVAEIDEVDVVYVATTNDLHHPNVLDSVARGKPVLCEKPLALNARRGREMAGAARAADVFLMEAMWMRFLPFVAKVDELVAAGAVGDVRHVQATMSYPGPREPDRRWLNRDLGGGSLLDLGVYPLSLVHHLLGPPEGFAASGRVGPTGVDLAADVVSRHAGPAAAAVSCSFVADLTNEAVIAGTEGRIRLHSRFHRSPRLTMERRGDVVATHDTGYEGQGFRFQVAEVERCLAAGLAESPIRPHAATLEVLEWMDAVRAAIGVTYEADAP